MDQIFKNLVGIGIVGSVISMVQFSKYCRLLSQRWVLDSETVKLYQAKAQRWLAATGCFIVTAAVSVFLTAVFT